MRLLKRTFNPLGHSRNKKAYDDCLIESMSDCRHGFYIDSPAMLNVFQ